MRDTERILQVRVEWFFEVPPTNGQRIRLCMTDKSILQNSCGSPREISDSDPAGGSFFEYATSSCPGAYIQYQINILKPLQCPQLQRAQGYVQLAPARKLA